MILYIFFTHEGNISKCQPRIVKMMKSVECFDYIIVVGKSPNTYKSSNISNDYYDEEIKTLHIQCNDCYEGLPEKVIKTYRYIAKSETFNKYSFFVKLDDDMQLKQLLPLQQIENKDYVGNVLKGQGNRAWHINKCSSTSPWNDKIYTGPFVPWCGGGYGYGLSRHSIETIQNANIKDKQIQENEIYEDLCVAKILNQQRIYPTYLETKRYFVSPDH